MLGRMITSVNLGTSIQTGEVDNLAITTAKIAADAVTAAKIADDAVGSEHIEDLSADLTLTAGVDLVLATTTGTKIGTGTDQLLGFYNATPVDQPATISDPDQSGDAAADTAANASAIGAIIDRLQELGLIA
tara:strand:+ start:557 stop:952 length:396 start_codon:yes stop_codon:yes gene_type:complete